MSANPTSRLGRFLQNALPNPFTIAILLTFLVMFLALICTHGELSLGNRLVVIAESWQSGLWNQGGLVFAVQMMLMLVLGHVMALSRPFDRLINKATGFFHDNASAAALVSFLTIAVALFNWGLALVFGAILARKAAESATRRRIPLNYPLIAAAGYSGLMVWHGGISGSAPIKAADPGALKALVAGSMDTSNLPASVTFEETVFSTMNLVVSALCLILIPLSMYWLAKRSTPDMPDVQAAPIDKEELSVNGAERISHRSWFGILTGGMILLFVLRQSWVHVSEQGDSGFITPDFINLLLFGTCLILHRNIYRFLKALDQAIGGASGILIQFPLYFGILGILSGTGMLRDFSEGMLAVSNADTFPFITFLSAGITNILVPSGGGQWAVQGPVVIDAANTLGVSNGKAIMALSYGDQLTNMLQPFWALPLLAITGLRAQDILPYTVYLMMVGGAIFTIGLLLF